MNRFVLVLLSTILILLLSVTGLLFYAFSENGNATLKHYIQQNLEEKLAMPVEVKKFTLEAGKASIVLMLNKQAGIEVLTRYDILSQSFKGIYRVKANNFHYDEMVLRQLELEGHFKGTADDMVVDGKGTALDAALAYRFSVLENIPKNIEAVMQGVAVEELLVLAGEAPLLHGKIDVDISMPDIGDEFANGYAHVILHQALFDAKMVQKMYDLGIPKKSYVSGKIDVKLKGRNLGLEAKANSNLFALSVNDAHIGLKEKNISAKYNMDVQEMAILTQNKLAGPLKVQGSVEGKGKDYRIEGLTHSLGGTLRFDISEHSKLHFQNLDLAKIQYLTKQPLLAKGLLSGSADGDKDLQSAWYDVQIQKGKLVAKGIEKAFGYQIPSDNHFTLTSKGKIVKKVLEAELVLKSNLSDIKLTKLNYGFEKKELHTMYDVFLPNLGILIPDNKAIKRGYLTLKGDLNFDKTLKVKGNAKGLGEKLAFVYDGKSVHLDAKNLFIEKLLSLGSLPRYVKGKLSTQVNISDINSLDGTFSFKGTHLETQPNVMERLLGKKLSIPLSFTSKGEVKKGLARLKTEIKTSMGTLKLEDTVVHTKSKNITSRYTLNIPKLEKTYTLTQKKLYGPMLLVGDITQDKMLKVRGSTASVGGKIAYTLIGDTLQSEITKVPLEKILALMGRDKLVQGDAYGTMNYNLKTKVGVLDIDIKAFQIKSSSTTKTVKMFIGKDPARIIYTSTKLHATMHGDITKYTLIAKGSHSRIEVTQGVVNKTNDTHRAKFKFVYEKYEVTGTIGGTVDKPRILVDPSAIMQSKTGEKIQKKLDKALGGDMGKAVGGFLKGLKF